MLDGQLGFPTAKSFHQFKMLGDIVFRHREKIAIRHRGQKFFDRLFVVVLQQLAAYLGLHPAKHGAHILALKFSLFGLFQNIQRLDVKLAQKRRFPGIPNFGTHGFDIGEGQQVKDRNPDENLRREQRRAGNLKCWIAVRFFNEAQLLETEHHGGHQGGGEQQA